jgi:quercetin dioxygenase-like cupin family protein
MFSATARACDLTTGNDRTGAGTYEMMENVMQKVSLIALTREHLAAASTAANGRSAHTIYGGHEHVLRQTLVALLEGQSLAEHENPGEATLQILHGRVRLAAGTDAWDGITGDHLAIPDTRHTLHALEDSVILLTVAKP